MTTTHERPSTELNASVPPVQPPAPRSGESTPPTPNRRKSRKKGAIILASVLAGTAVLGVAGYAVLNPSTSVSQGSDPGEPNDGGQPNGGEVVDGPDLSTDSQPITVEQFPANAPEAVVRKYFVENDEWLNAGNTPENNQLILKDTTGTVGQTILDATNEPYKDSLISKNIAPGSELDAYVQKIVDSHGGYFSTGFLTDPAVSGIEGTKSFKYTTVIDNIQITNETTDEKIVALVTIHPTANLDENEGEQHIENGGFDPTPRNTKLTWTIEDGKWVVSDAVRY